VPFAVWLCVLSAGAFLGFLAISDATHLLGDGGRVILAAITGDRPPITEVLASALNRAAVVAGHKLSLSPDRSLEILSAALGAVLVAIVVLRSHAAGTEAWRRIFFAGSILVTGALQLYCGYVESYPLLLVFVIAYLMCVLVTVADAERGWEASAFLALAIGSHISAVCLLPAHIAYLRVLSRRGSGAVLAGVCVCVCVCDAGDLRGHCPPLPPSMVSGYVWPGAAAARR
jgi:hypothetical protein